MTEVATKAVQPDFRRAELRVKIKSLMVEARLIRQEEDRAREHIARSMASVMHPGVHVEEHRRTFRSLREHRVWSVRKESRLALLAYAFLRGRDRERTEGKRAPSVAVIDGIRLHKLIERFGFGAVEQTKVFLWLGHVA